MVTAQLRNSDSSTGSPDITPLDFPFFFLYKILLMEEISIPWKTVKGIWKWNCEVPEKWQKVVEQKGQYIILYSS